MISVAGGLKPGGITDIEQEFYRLLVVGKQTKVVIDDNEQDATVVHAQKLEIEQQAIRDRLSRQQQQKEVFQAISEQLQDTITDAMAHQFSDINALLKQTHITQSQWQLLDKLQNSKLNLNQLRGLIEKIAWLKNDLINLVNSPSFRHFRGQGSDVKVSDLKLVLNYIGLEQVRLLIPYYCMRSWLPRKHSTSSIITRRIWRFANVASIAARALAKHHNQDPCVIFSVCLGHFMGAATVIERCSQVFESIRGDWLRQAQEDRDKLVYDAILATPFPKESVCLNVIKYGSQLNWKILQELDIENSSLFQYLSEMDQKLSYRGMSLPAAIATKSIIFAKLLLLQEQNMLKPKEKRLMFDYYEISKEELSTLRNQNYRKQELF
ncbi:HDOD domain-containing protein [Parashewanella curva]|uniref:HDOD domain-containing protein n=1 Tax=Parashewanella curva TaxID=2338552 RepID=A0A3L8PUN0_9GAMM|nr:HDOD domain-containing protein [Parashewanella curva]RLV58128.1 HDOD domain-containing protein [Parashewanella curva]